MWVSGERRRVKRGTLGNVGAIGRVTVVALQLNNDNLVVARSFWISVGWHPPVESSVSIIQD